MGTRNPGARVDASRAVVLPGSGAAIRLPGLLCLLRPSPDDAASPGIGHLARLVEILTENSAAHPATPGRPLARRLARWLGSLDPGPDFGTIAATDTGIAIFLHGGVDAVVGGQRHSARDSGAWLDQLLDYPPGPLVLVPSDDPTPDNSPRGVFDLRGGVVPAGTVLLVPRSGTLPSVLASPTMTGNVSGAGAGDGDGKAPREAPQAPLDVPDDVSAPMSAPAPAPLPATVLAAASGGVEAAASPVGALGAAPAAGAVVAGVESTPPAPLPAAVSPPPARPAALAGGPARVSPILGVGPDEPPRAPLEAGGPSTGRHSAPPAPVPASGNGGPAAEDSVAMAAGFRCVHDHLNDPRNHFCVVCGVPMNERTGVVEVGPRPPLGVLVFDDGSTYPLDTDYLLGRMPETDPRVVGGELRPLPVEDPQAQLSRGHLVIRLDGWDVTAIDESTNGTLVAHASDRAWSRLTPRTPLRLLPGTRVRVGGRSFVFESPSGVR